ncbi:site-specific integrase [Dyella agri]|uniref:Site-specific integrase n=2 Tax=Dyella agri TaxID=1926869 RepID=A0ABW8KIZ0_9GAMM
MGIVSMPKPFIFQRSTGWYVRFLVPQHARAAMGSRFIVRALGNMGGDEVRLMAAQLGYALSRQCAALRASMTDASKSSHQALKLSTKVDLDPWGFAREAVNYTIEIAPDGTRRIHALGPADHAMALEMLREMDKRYQPTAIIPASAAVLPAAGPTPLLSERISLFLAQFKQKQRATANVLDTTHTLRLFLGVVGDKPLSAIGPDDIDAFLAAIADWPINASKKPDYKDLDVLGVLALSRRLHPPTIGLRTQEKHLDRLRVFLNWCVKRQHLPTNPASDVHVMTRSQEDERSRRAFLPSELQALFDPERRDKHCRTPARWWIPLLALHSGARVNELAQLNTADIEEIDHVWGFHVATRFSEQHLKNSKTKRFVPLHRALLEAGFLAYVADVTQAQNQATGPLFPGLGKSGGDKVGDWWNRTYMPLCGIKDDKLVFHCFRHTFATFAERAGMSEGRIARITGHSTKGSILSEFYIDPPTLLERVGTVNAVAYDLPPPAPYVPRSVGAFFPKLDRVQQRRVAVEARAARQAQKSR